MNDIPTLLLAEDNPADVYLIREALRAHNLAIHLHVVNDGEAAIEFIETADGGGEAPGLALLDINLPKKTGIEVLERLRQSPTCGGIPVAIISSAGSPRECTGNSTARATHFFSKPSNYEKFMRLGELVKEMLHARGGEGH